MTSRQVQKLSADGPRRSARPAMPRWKVWLCRFGRPGTAAPEKRVASPASTPVSTAAMTPFATVTRHVVVPAARHERGREMQLAHAAPGP